MKFELVGVNQLFQCSDASLAGRCHSGKVMRPRFVNILLDALFHLGQRTLNGSRGGGSNVPAFRGKLGAHRCPSVFSTCCAVVASLRPRCSRASTCPLRRSFSLFVISSTPPVDSCSVPVRRRASEARHAARLLLLAAPQMCLSIGRALIFASGNGGQALLRARSSNLHCL